MTNLSELQRIKIYLSCNYYSAPEARLLADALQELLHSVSVDGVLVWHPDDPRGGLKPTGDKWFALQEEIKSSSYFAPLVTRKDFFEAEDGDRDKEWQLAENWDKTPLPIHCLAETDIPDRLKEPKVFKAWLPEDMRQLCRILVEEAGLNSDMTKPWRREALEVFDGTVKNLFKESVQEAIKKFKYPNWWASERLWRESPDRLPHKVLTIFGESHLWPFFWKYLLKVMDAKNSKSR